MVVVPLGRRTSRPCSWVGRQVGGRRWAYLGSVDLLYHIVGQGGRWAGREVGGGRWAYLGGVDLLHCVVGPEFVHRPRDQRVIQVHEVRLRVARHGVFLLQRKIEQLLGVSLSESQSHSVNDAQVTVQMGFPILLPAMVLLASVIVFTGGGGALCPGGLCPGGSLTPRAPPYSKEWVARILLECILVYNYENKLLPEKGKRQNFNQEFHWVKLPTLQIFKLLNERKKNKKAFQ